MSATADLSFSGSRPAGAKPVLRGGVGISLGLHAVLLLAAVWRWQTAPLIEPPAETSLPLVFEAPAGSTRDLPQADIAPAQAIDTRSLAPRTGVFLPAHGVAVPHAPPRRSAGSGRPATGAQAGAGAPVGVPVPSPAPSAPAEPPPDPAAMGAFESKVQSAVQDAAVYPAMARLQHRQGRARVRFTYASGHAVDAVLMESSHSAILDRAALSAVQRADLPAAPVQIAARRLDLLVWVSFKLGGVAD